MKVHEHLKAVHFARQRFTETGASAELDAAIDEPVTAGLSAAKQPACGLERISRGPGAPSGFGDTNRDLIYATASKVYARGRRGSYDLHSADF
jgi:hypothetical protein